MRNRLIFSALALALTASSAFAQFAGCWRNVRNGNLPCYVEERGGEIVFTNEYGSRSYGRLVAPNVAVAYDWNSIYARLVGGGQVMLWDGNGEWRRDPYCTP